MIIGTVNYSLQEVFRLMKVRIYSFYITSRLYDWDENFDSSIYLGGGSLV